MAGLMGSTAKGSATLPVYWNGKAWATITSYDGKASTAGTADKVAKSLSVNGKSFDGSAAVDVGTLGISYGGTGATTASTALTNLGAAAVDHTHGMITNDGKLSGQSNKVMVVDANGSITAYGGTAVRSMIGAEAANTCLPLAGGTMTGYISWGNAANAGLEWTTDNGTRIHLRPYSPSNLFQITMQPSGGSEFGALSIDTEGNISFIKALTVANGGTGASDAATALANLGAVPLVGGVTISGDMTFAANLLVSNDSSAGGYVKLWEDNEGGNIELGSKSGYNYQLDAYNDNLRLYSQKSGSVVTMATGDGSTGAWSIPGLTVSGADAFYFSGMTEATTNADRPVWFGGQNKTGSPTYNNNLTYNPSTHKLKLDGYESQTLWLRNATSSTAEVSITFYQGSTQQWTLGVGCGSMGNDFSLWNHGTQSVGLQIRKADNYMIAPYYIANKSSGDSYFAAKRTDVSQEIRFGIGSGGENRGIYDKGHNRWVFKVTNTGVDLSAMGILYSSTQPTAPWAGAIWLKPV